MPISASLPTSVFSPSTGVWSSFQSRCADAPRRGLDDEGDRVGDRVRHADELDAERPGSSGSSCRRLHFDELRRLTHAVLVELRLHEPQRQARRHDRLDVDLAQEVREAAHVVLVTMGQYDRPNLAPLQVADIGQEEIDSQVLVAREGEARVDDEDLARGLVHGHVLADLAEAAERDDPQRVAHLLVYARGYRGNASTAKRSPSATRRGAPRRRVSRPARRGLDRVGRALAVDRRLAVTTTLRLDRVAIESWSREDADGLRDAGPQRPVAHGGGPIRR